MYRRGAKWAVAHVAAPRFDLHPPAESVSHRPFRSGHGESMGWAMRASWVVGAVLFVGSATAIGQTSRSSASATAATPSASQTSPVVPPGGTGYFGPANEKTFNEKAMFPAPTPAAPAVPPPPPPTLIPDGSLPPPPPPRIWTGGFEIGLNGQQGNTDVLNVRIGANADRKTAENLFHFDLLYLISRQDGTTSQNQALSNTRDEILFPGSPWSVFTALQIEYDEFRDYDFRVGVYTGLAYAWVNTPATLFKTRAGVGAQYEISIAGGAPDKWVPEAVLGYDFNHKFTDRQGFVSTVDVYPSLANLGQYRVRARAAYEIVIDPDHGMVLRLGVQDRYDSNPGTSKRNDVNFFASLLFKF